MKNLQCFTKHFSLGSDCSLWWDKMDKYLWGDMDWQITLHKGHRFAKSLGFERSYIIIYRVFCCTERSTHFEMPRCLGKTSDRTAVRPVASRIGTGNNSRQAWACYTFSSHLDSKTCCNTNDNEKNRDNKNYRNNHAFFKFMIQTTCSVPCKGSPCKGPWFSIFCRRVVPLGPWSCQTDTTRPLKLDYSI